MYAKGKRKGSIRFSLKTSVAAKQVALVASFNSWKPITMTKQQDGQFTAECQAPAGTHEYKYIVDGAWMTDPDHAQVARNAYGTHNSVASIS